jgi:molybdopterin converting factor small subunit
MMPVLHNPGAAATVEIELFGVPRVVTGKRSVSVVACTLGDAANKLALAYPDLIGTVIDQGTDWLFNGYTFVVDDSFTRDPKTPLSAGVSVLLVSSVAGG